jgi:hypothetical protein
LIINRCAQNNPIIPTASRLIQNDNFDLFHTQSTDIVCFVEKKIKKKVGKKGGE